MNYFIKRTAKIVPLAMAVVLQGLTVSAENTEVTDILTAALANESVMTGVDMTSSYNMDLVVNTGGSDVPLKMSGTVDIKSTPFNGEMKVTHSANRNIMGEDNSTTEDRYFVNDGADGLKEYICTDGLLWSTGDCSLYQMFEAIMTTDINYFAGLEWSLDPDLTDITEGNDCYVLRTSMPAEDFFSKSMIGRISEDDEFNAAFEAGMVGVTANIVYYIDEDTLRFFMRRECFLLAPPAECVSEEQQAWARECTRIQSGKLLSGWWNRYSNRDKQRLLIRGMVSLRQ